MQHISCLVGTPRVRSTAVSRATPVTLAALATVSTMAPPAATQITLDDSSRPFSSVPANVSRHRHLTRASAAWPPPAAVSYTHLTLPTSTTV